ncbi:midasin isoform X1 [Cinnamomum micranthum f. kanehirae]|uniref:Midasin isoform X1 n=1 Tax=Cinnamomum micranthum f. kanehirae TaxID=337451 RepID=A0A3S4P5Q6_9MAGN|nr:midasin isoform X1 [Cinnamomum micranthum f. kanehirae]
MDDCGELNNDETDKLSDEDENPDINGDDHGNTDEMKLNKETAFEDRSGIQLDDQQFFEDESMDNGSAGPDAKEEGSDDPNDTANDMDTDDGETNPMDDLIDDANPSQVDGNVENDEQGMEGAENGDKDLGTKDNELTAPGMDPADDSILNTDSLQPVNKAGTTADSSLAFESDSRDPQYSLAPSRNFPSDHLPEMGMTLPISSKAKKSTSDQPKAQSPQDDTSSVRRTHSNPYRSIGDALEEWKERIKICADGQQENEPEASDVLEDENVDEYAFVSELEKDNSVREQKREDDAMKVVDEDSEIHHIGHYNASALRQKMDEKMQESGITSAVPMEEELPEVDCQPGNQSGDLIIMDNSYMNNDVLKLNNLSMIDQDLGKGKNIEEVSFNTEYDNAAAIWRRYELTTTSLSQELTEQLRLVMEPTVASKLQGDYKTGKRINMKKVIPYIASDYRKDKIWLRRTRPNKRDYQVVITIDDSRSMSESRCGEVAIEALITVCRAMSQLQVGQLAAVSFGSQGNVRLLQGFGQPFTGEAGIKMISSLTFKQDNTIADEPMVNLLKELNGMLDSAVAYARLPTGQNPLQQLILIIADGRLHEKESLKRCVQDVLSRKRMIAFILLDSPQESIVDLMSATYPGGKLSFSSRYINSFPFPYYVVLKNIESLPRTMASLLRQWFELMQSSGD